MLGAASLEAGTSAFERLAGTSPPPGGRHPRMGTHNRLTRIADGVFLEIIAIDPNAPAPARPRWFSLDDPATVARFATGLALLTWVVAVDDLDVTLDRARKAGVDAGRPVEQVRDDLRWRIALSDDGSLVEGGAFPVLIEWPPGTDAAARMSDIGLRLETLSVTHGEPERIVSALAAIGADRLVTVAAGESDVAATLSIEGRSLTF